MAELEMDVSKQSNVPVCSLMAGDEVVGFIEQVKYRCERVHRLGETGLWDIQDAIRRRNPWNRNRRRCKVRISSVKMKLPRPKSGLIVSSSTHYMVIFGARHLGSTRYLENRPALSEDTDREFPSLAAVKAVCEKHGLVFEACP